MKHFNTEKKEPLFVRLPLQSSVFVYGESLQNDYLR